MASKTFLLLALAFAAVLLITSEVVTAKEASSLEHDSKILRGSVGRTLDKGLKRIPVGRIFKAIDDIIPLISPAPQSSEGNKKAQTHN